MTREPVLLDLETERRVIAALLVEPAVLRDADQLELEDLTDFRLASVLAAIRNLQTRSMLVEPLEVDAAIARRDADHGSRLVEKSGLAFMAELLISTTPYRFAVLWEHDIAWLRRLADRRRAACASPEIFA